MGSAAATHHLGALHPPAMVGCFFNMFAVRRRVETGPAAFGVELSVRAQKFVAAANAEVDALIMKGPVFSGKGSFGALSPRHCKLFGCQHLAPFFIGLGDSLAHGSCRPEGLMGLILALPGAAVSTDRLWHYRGNS